VAACQIEGAASDDISAGEDDMRSGGGLSADGDGPIAIGSDGESLLQSPRSSVCDDPIGPDASGLATPTAASVSSSSSSSVHLSDIDFTDVRMSDVDDDGFLSDSDVYQSSEDSMVGLGKGGEASEEDDARAPKKGKADVMVVFAHGIVRYYASAQILVATCKYHGSRCRLTKTVSNRHNLRNHGQGRPLGLLCAWMAEGATMLFGAGHRVEHNNIAKDRTLTHAQRVTARALAMLVAGVDLLCDKKRPRREGEPEEPDDIT
jgi:hypothetical protein